MEIDNQPQFTHDELVLIKEFINNPQLQVSLKVADLALSLQEKLKDII